MSINIDNTLHTFTNDALGNLDTVALREKLLSKELSSQQLVEAAIKRAECSHPELNAIVIKDYSRAIEQSACPLDGKLSGIPSFVKDTDDAKGLTTAIGSSAVRQKKAKKDSSFVKQFKQTGLINLGKSTTPEFGLTGTTEAIKHGPTLNPWNKRYTPGGSSGGAAALVAAGVVPIAHANDGAGSIRIPASCCGLVGMKPTRGRTAFVDGSRVLPVNILHQGVVTRTVRDTAAFYAAIEPLKNAKKLPPIGQVEGASNKRQTLALLTDGADDECGDVARTAARLLQAQGHHVDGVSLPFTNQVMDDFFILWAGMAYSLNNFGSFFVGRGFDKTQTEPLTKGLSQSFRDNIRHAPAAFRRLKKFAHDYADFFTRYDCLLSPTLGHAPPKLGHLSTTESFEVCMERMRDFFPFTPYQNISGAPAISMPMSLSKEGLPIGVQLAGAWGQEKRLLELAYELEGINQWKHLYEQ